MFQETALQKEKRKRNNCQIKIGQDGRRQKREMQLKTVSKQTKKIQQQRTINQRKTIGPKKKKKKGKKKEPTQSIS